MNQQKVSSQLVNRTNRPFQTLPSHKPSEDSYLEQYRTYPTVFSYVNPQNSPQDSENMHNLQSNEQNIRFFGEQGNQSSLDSYHHSLPRRPLSQPYFRMQIDNNIMQTKRIPSAHSRITQSRQKPKILASYPFQPPQIPYRIYPTQISPFSEQTSDQIRTEVGSDQQKERIRSKVLVYDQLNHLKTDFTALTIIDKLRFPVESKNRLSLAKRTQVQSHTHNFPKISIKKSHLQLESHQIILPSSSIVKQQTIINDRYLEHSNQWNDNHQPSVSKIPVSIQTSSTEQISLIKQLDSSSQQSSQKITAYKRNQFATVREKQQDFDVNIDLQKFSNNSIIQAQLIQKNKIKLKKQLSQRKNSLPDAYLELIPFQQKLRDQKVPFYSEISNFYEEFVFSKAHYSKVTGESKRWKPYINSTIVSSSTDRIQSAQEADKKRWRNPLVILPSLSKQLPILTQLQTSIIQ